MPNKIIQNSSTYFVVWVKLKQLKQLKFTNNFFFWFQLLTCINPSITFNLKTPDQGEKKFNGLAVALAPFLAKLSNHGLDTMAPQDRIKQDIKNHGLGVTTKAKQVFNANDDGATISRCKEAKDTTVFRNCVFIKRSAFRPEAWEEFATCNYYSLLFLDPDSCCTRQNACQIRIYKPNNHQGSAKPDFSLW